MILPKGDPPKKPKGTGEGIIPSPMRVEQDIHTEIVRRGGKDVFQSFVHDEKPVVTPDAKKLRVKADATRTATPGEAANQKRRPANKGEAINIPGSLTKWTAR